MFTCPPTCRACSRSSAATGADVNLVNGLINDCGAKVREGVAQYRWFDVSTLREPYRIEGKKTMGYDRRTMDSTLPDVIICPTGGGTGLVRMSKAFDEMERIGLIGPQRRRMVSVQSTGLRADRARVRARGGGC